MKTFAKDHGKIFHWESDTFIRKSEKQSHLAVFGTPLLIPPLAFKTIKLYIHNHLSNVKKKKLLKKLLLKKIII